jgi:hypothetical protein
VALDGDIPALVLIAGAIDLPHPTRANLLDHAVVAQRLADHGKAPVARHLRPRPQASQREGLRMPPVIAVTDRDEGLLLK